MKRLKIKRIFDSSPELRVKPLGRSKSSMRDIIGDQLVFKLNSRRAKRRKEREAEGGAPATHFDAQVDMIKGKYHLSVENEDMPALKNALDTNGDGNISNKELKSVSVSSVQMAL